MSLIRYVLAFALFMHGLAHLSGFFAAWTKADVGYPDRPWVLAKTVTLKSPIGRFFGLLWLVAAFALASSRFGLAFGQGWWWMTAMFGSAVSLFVILPWLLSVPPGAWAGAVFDVVILLVLILPWKDRVLQFLS